MENIINSKILLVFVFLAFLAIKGKVETDSEDVFVPTEEWQVVKEGQKLPKGLHVRINLSTGLKEAKLVQPNSSKANALQVVENEDDTHNLKLQESDLKRVLKNIKNDDTTKSKTDSKFRSYNELKLELKGLNLNPKTEAELLKLLLDKYKKLTNAKKLDKYHILSILEEIDYLIHQSDNAVEFVRLKGLEEVIYKNLNSTIVEFKLDSLKLFGSLVQNNAKVQIQALETGALDFLLRVLVLNSEYYVKNRAVFALSSLMRHFPLAQLKFIENAGLNVFLEILSKTSDIKIRLKVATLINDLVLEYIEAMDDHSNPEKIKQYSKVDLKNKLIELDWCKYLTILFTNIYDIDRNDHDGLEKSLTAILSIVDDCKASYIGDIENILKDLQLRYSALAAETDWSDDSVDIEYCKHMESISSAIINYHSILKKIKIEL